MIRIGKEFRWEMGHRLPYHTEGCANVHGHSYRLEVIVEGTPDEGGMLIDYGRLGEIVDPLVKELDHCFICFAEDREMLEFLRRMEMKHVVIPFHSTAENMCEWMLERFAEPLAGYPNLYRLTVRLHETAKVFAETSIELNTKSQVKGEAASRRN
jgi:6-pyruvoyltetrahydropterin/6-carboxytetrahydropterin synthase